MTKQEFTELFEVVQQYHEQSRELGEMLHKTLHSYCLTQRNNEY